RHAVEVRRERSDLVRGTVRDPRREIARSESVCGVTQLADRLRDRARRERAEDQRQRDGEYGEDGVVAIRRGERDRYDAERFTQISLRNVLVPLNQWLQHVDVVRIDPRLEILLGCLRIGPRQIAELVDQRMVHGELDAQLVEPRRELAALELRCG